MSARASLAQAKANADRARLVKDSGAISEQQVAEYLATEQTALAAVEQAEAQVAAQKVTLAQTRIVAVDDGIVTAKSALLGQVVSAGTSSFSACSGKAASNGRRRSMHGSWRRFAPAPRPR